MGPDSDPRMTQFGAFDKAAPSWRARTEPKMADDRPKRCCDKGNCQFASRKIFKILQNRSPGKILPNRSQGRVLNR
jgi:hypothetical protein